MPESQPESGFSLVEVMVAMAILSLAMLALLRLGGVGASTAVETERATIADMVAETALVEALVSKAPPLIGDAVTDIRMGGVAWQVSVETAALANGLYAIRVDVADVRGVAASLEGVRTPPAP
ncbi:MAG: type II secretion system protein [Pseudomonadota bacterium]